jgi:hypothetical protein
LRGNLYALLAGGGCSHGNPNTPSGIARVDRSSGKWTVIADIGAWLKTHPAKFESADDFEPDRTLYDMIAADGVLYAVEPNHGQLLAVRRNGAIQQLIDISASQRHIVPTSVAERHEVFYVGNLNLFPIDPQWARVQAIARGDSEDDSHLAPGFSPGHGFHIVSSKRDSPRSWRWTSAPMDCCMRSSSRTRPVFQLPARARSCASGTPARSKR